MIYKRLALLAMVTTVGTIPRDSKSSVLENRIVIEIPVNHDVDISEEMKVQNDIKVRYAEKLAKEAEEAERKRLAKRKRYIYNIVANPDNIKYTTGLKEEDFKYLTKNTWWSGNESILAEMEQRYGINAIFCMAVSTLESESGTSRIANEEGNYYGLHSGILYTSLYDNTMDWADRINKYYVAYGRSSVWMIGPKYCPLNRGWEVYMAQYMYDHRRELIVNLLDTLD